MAQATFKILKTELFNLAHYQNLNQLSLELFGYVNLYNNIRSHSTLGYLSPIAYMEVIRNLFAIHVGNET